MTFTFLKRALFGVSLLLTLAASQALAQSTSSAVTVTATVNGVCRFYTPTATLTLANSGIVIDPSSATAATGTVNLTYRCTSGTTPLFDVDATGAFASPKTNPAITLTGPGSLTASVTVTGGGPGTGMGAGGANDINAVVSGTIAAAGAGGFAGAAPGVYSKVVTIEIQP
jgi:hypothetical protein